MIIILIDIIKWYKPKPGLVKEWAGNEDAWNPEDELYYFTCATWLIDTEGKDKYTDRKRTVANEWMLLTDKEIDLIGSPILEILRLVSGKLKAQEVQ